MLVNEHKPDVSNKKYSEDAKFGKYLHPHLL
jgi:hypothetical protein